MIPTIHNIKLLYIIPLIETKLPNKNSIILIMFVINYNQLTLIFNKNGTPYRN